MSQAVRESHGQRAGAATSDQQLESRGRRAGAATSDQQLESRGRRAGAATSDQQLESRGRRAGAATSDQQLESHGRRAGTPRREIHNPRTGQTMRFLLTAADTDGALLRIHTTNPPTAVAEPVHVHPRQESRAEVISGALRFTVAGRDQTLGPGEAITIPAGMPHHFVNDGDEEAVSVQEFRPALRTQELFETLFDLAGRGELDEQGRPSLLRVAVLGPAFADEIRLASPPWPVQRVAFAILRPLARVRGY